MQLQMSVEQIVQPSSSKKDSPHLFVPAKHEREKELAGVELATFRRRLAAFSIDGLLIGSLLLAFVIVGGLWMASMGWIDPDDDINIGLNMDNWYSVLILAVYFATSHYWTDGQHTTRSPKPSSFENTRNHDHQIVFSFLAHSIDGHYDRVRGS